MKCVILSVLAALLSTSCQSVKTDVVEPRLSIRERNFQIWLKTNDQTARSVTRKNAPLVCPQDDGHQQPMMFEVD